MRGKHCVEGHYELGKKSSKCKGAKNHTYQVKSSMIDDHKTTSKNSCMALSAEKLLLLFSKPRKHLYSVVAYIDICHVVDIYTTRHPTLKNCHVMLIYGSIFWAIEVIPLFVTSLLVPLLIVVIPDLQNEENISTKTPKEASQFIILSCYYSSRRAIQIKYCKGYIYSCFDLCSNQT